ncbi:cytosolic phospholipase A2-like [Mercenaria mercenaria]|uniref:cytosolic phospholipase A2-like n=1 Tax=Mercenaria mercenaria TaxID=6596 RepID=UPI00234F6B6B|nr:cytosolic phospholipase A2-like [Mercenaria mercenaria]
MCIDKGDGYWSQDLINIALYKDLIRLSVPHDPAPQHDAATTESVPLKNTGRLDARLTDQREKLREGKIPLPMYAAVRVKTDVSAKVFHEWMEFTPYEIGILKYKIYIPAEMFGSKFFMGHLVKNCEEPRLHFLQGIWGSAYCVLLKRFFWKKDKKNSKQERDELEIELNDSDSSDTSDSEDDDSDSEDANDEHEKKEKETDESIFSIFSLYGKCFRLELILKTCFARIMSCTAS